MVSQTGVLSGHVGRKNEFRFNSTEASSALYDKKTQAVVISTRHDSHYELVLAALENRKDIFVEKPLCLSLDELELIKSKYYSIKKSDEITPSLVVGFNRRFSPFVKKIKEIIDINTGPKSFIYTINAGKIPSDHWLNDPQEGGGRVIGEACHFLDLIVYLSGSSLKTWSFTGDKGQLSENFIISMKFEDNSVGSINYFNNGPKSYPKENLTIFSDGKILILDNFRSLKGFGWKGFSKMKTWKQDKGQSDLAKEFICSLTSDRNQIIPIEDIFSVSQTIIQMATKS